MSVLFKDTDARRLLGALLVVQNICMSGTHHGGPCSSIRSGRPLTEECPMTSETSRVFCPSLIAICTNVRRHLLSSNLNPMSFSTKLFSVRTLRTKSILRYYSAGGGEEDVCCRDGRLFRPPRTAVLSVVSTVSRLIARPRSCVPERSRRGFLLRPSSSGRSRIPAEERFRFRNIVSYLTFYNKSG